MREMSLRDEVTTPGLHQLRERALSGDSQLQPAEERGEAPPVFRAWKGH